mmetsp:Transcript_32042/g.80918  ORF Transcript_32042/g.80918 Transcript_32042/m.80918 type:complete len:698 (-) Transcript_32042:116-2209(-)
MQQTQSDLGRGVDLLFVFDGAPTPAKRSTDSARQVRRAKAYAAVQYDGAEADPKMLRAAVSLGWPAVVAVLSQLRRAGIPYIVAPFEADAQLSLLARDGKIWAAVTIDSDFIIHGLPRVFFKVNWRPGRCLLYSKAVLQDPDRWPELPSKFKPPQQLLPIVKDAGLPAMLCFGLLDGCDYGTKIRGVGVVKASEILEDVVKQHGAVALQDVRGAVTLMAQEVLKHLNRRGDFDADAWIPTALNAIDVFQHALAYNPETRKVETVDHMPINEAITRWPFLGFNINDCDAEGRALGLITPAGAPQELPHVSSIRTPAIAWQLTEDMVLGPELREPFPLPNEHGEWPADFRPTVAQLRHWCRTRHGMPLFSGASRSDLVRRVKERQLVEKEMQDKEERVLFRDPHGRSLQDHILSSHPDHAWHFAEATDGEREELLPTEGWVTGIQQIGRDAPTVDQTLLLSHWEHRLHLLNGGTRTILDDAFSRVAEMQHLPHFAFHPNENATMPRTRHGGSQRLVCFKFSAPASQRMETTYHLWVECNVSALPGLRPFISRILRCGCTCPLRSSADCVHLLMLMLVILNLPRPWGEPPCTSLRCAWLNPGNGDTYDVTTPLPFIPFMRTSFTPQRLRDASGMARRVLPVSDNAGWRYKFNPVPLADRDAVQHGRSTAARVAAREALWEEMQRALNGDRCAADVAWRGL